MLCLLKAELMPFWLPLSLSLSRKTICAVYHTTYKYSTKNWNVAAIYIILSCPIWRTHKNNIFDNKAHHVETLYKQAQNVLYKCKKLHFQKKEKITCCDHIIYMMIRVVKLYQFYKKWRIKFSGTSCRHKIFTANSKHKKSITYTATKKDRRQMDSTEYINAKTERGTSKKS